MSHGGGPAVPPASPSPATRPAAGRDRAYGGIRCRSSWGLHLRCGPEPAFLQLDRQAPQAAAHALARVVLGARELSCDLGVRQAADHVQLQYLALIARKRLQGLDERVLDRGEVDEVLDSLVVLG